MNANDKDKRLQPGVNDPAETDRPKSEQLPGAEPWPAIDDQPAQIPIDGLDSLLHEINIEYGSAVEDRDDSAVLGSADEASHDNRTSTQSLAGKLAPLAASMDVETIGGPGKGRTGASEPDKVSRWPGWQRPVVRLAGRTDTERNGKLPTPAAGRTVLAAGLTVLIFAAAVSAFSLIEPLNRLLPERAAFVADNTDGDHIEAPVQNEAGPADVRHANAIPPATKSSATLATDTLADPSATSPIDPDIAPAQNDKSGDRIPQDAVVQAILKDPEKRALEAGNETSVEVRGPDFDADPVTTGSIRPPASGDFADAGAEKPEASTGTDINTSMSYGLNTPANVSLDLPVADAAIVPVIRAPGPALPHARPAPPTARLGATSERISGTTPQPSKVDRLLDRAHGLLQRGDIAPARRVFQRVAALGDSRGAKGVAMTYDPDVFKDLAVVGLTPDPDQAKAWYRKAQEMSSKEFVFSGAEKGPDPGLQN